MKLNVVITMLHQWSRLFGDTVMCNQHKKTFCCQACKPGEIHTLTNLWGSCIWEDKWNTSKRMIWCCSSARQCKYKLDGLPSSKRQWFHQLVILDKTDPPPTPPGQCWCFFLGGGGLREEFQKTLVLFRWNSCHGHPRFQEFSSAFCLVSLLSDRKALWTFSLRTARADRISAVNVSRSFCRTERVFHDQTAHPWRVGSVSSEIVLSLADLMCSVWKLPGPVDQLWQMESALGLARAWQICLLLRVPIHQPSWSLLFRKMYYEIPKLKIHTGQGTKFGLVSNFSKLI